MKNTILILSLLPVFFTIDSIAIDKYQSYSRIVIKANEETGTLKEVHRILHNGISTNNNLEIYLLNNSEQSIISYSEWIEKIKRSTLCDSLYYLEFTWLGKNYDSIFVYSISPLYKMKKSNRLTPLYNVNPLMLKRILPKEQFIQLIKQIQEKIIIKFEGLNKNIPLSIHHEQEDISDDSAKFFIIHKVVSDNDFWQSKITKLVSILDDELRDWSIKSYSDETCNFVNEPGTKLIYISNLGDSMPDKIPIAISYNIKLTSIDTSSFHSIGYILSIVSIGFNYSNYPTIWFNSLILENLLEKDLYFFKYSLLKDRIISELVKQTQPSYE